MGLIGVEISGQFWQEIMTKGWKPGDIECIEGLPEGAIFRNVFYRQWPAVSGVATPSLVFVFEHDDFDEVLLGATPLLMNVVYQRHYPDE